MKTNGNEYQVLIVAAGCSRRMKKFKPMLPLGNGTLLESTIGSFRKAGFSNITVVVGYQKQKLTRILQKYDIQIVENPEYDQSDMMESIKCGIREMQLPERGILFCPGDVPMIAPETIQRTVEVYEQTGARILIPTYHGEPGHPPVFSIAVCQAILEYRGDAGLRGVLAELSDITEYLEVEDPEILMDTDLPEDYQRLLKLYEARRG